MLPFLLKETTQKCRSRFLIKICGMYKFRYEAGKSVQGKVNYWKMLNLAQFTKNKRKVYKISYAIRH